jgi:hypothetical protein
MNLQLRAYGLGLIVIPAIAATMVLLFAIAFSARWIAEHRADRPNP